MVVDTIEAAQPTEIVNRHDGALDDAAMLAEIGVSEGTAGFDEENKPSSGEPEIKEGIWSAPQPAATAEVTNHGDTPVVTETATAAPIVEASIQPIATGLSEAPVQTMDSQFMANEDGKAPTEPLSPDLKVPDSPAGLSVAPAERGDAFTESVIPATTQAETQNILNKELPTTIAETQAKFDKIIGSDSAPATVAEVVTEVVDPQEAVDQISDPQERLEARTASVKEVLAKMRLDLEDINSELDKRLVEVQSKFEARTRAADAKEKEAEDQIRQAEAVRIDAGEEKIKAQNDLERDQGEIAGKKSEIVGKLDKIESLQV